MPFSMSKSTNSQSQCIKIMDGLPRNWENENTVIELRAEHQMEIIRATKTAEQAGAYYVRIQAMARKHQITLYAEFDEHDTPETKYIVIVDNYLPVATCRLYAIDDERVMLGRIVVLPEYRHQ